MAGCIVPADAPSASRRRNYKEESDSAPSESDEEEAHDPFAADDLDDPTIVDSTGQTNRAGWALNQPSRWEGDLQGGPKLPRERAKQLGRRCTACPASFWVATYSVIRDYIGVTYTVQFCCTRLL